MTKTTISNKGSTMFKIGKRVYRNFLEFCSINGIKVKLLKETIVGGTTKATVTLLNAKLVPLSLRDPIEGPLAASSTSFRGAVTELLLLFGGKRIEVTLPPTDEEKSREIRHRVTFPFRAELNDDAEENDQSD